MNYVMLEKVISDTIMEEQLKLGYEKETVRLYYPMSSIAHILEEKFDDMEKLDKALALFSDMVSDRLGKLTISRKEDRYCILIPPEGSVYVHENIKANPFLVDLIDGVRKHDCSLEQILDTFRKYSNQVKCMKSSTEDFDYVIYFTDQNNDDYRYCFKFEHGHAIYHRFARKDFEALNIPVIQYDNKRGAAIDKEKEHTYQNMISLMKSIRCMTPSAEKIKLYRQIIIKLEGLSEYKASKEKAEECKLSLKQIRKDIKKRQYKAAVKMKAASRNFEDYTATAEKFRKLKGFRDSDELALECEALSSRMEKSLIIRRIMYLIVVILCIGIAILAVMLPQTTYYIARIYQMSGLYGKAGSMYEKAGNYQDSKERLSESRYRYGLQLLTSKKEYALAENYFVLAQDYRDSDTKRVLAQIMQIREGEAGDKVNIGGSKWIILEKNEAQAFLIKLKAVQARAYHDSGGPVTWEKSTLRKWLNTDFIENNFSNAERENMILSEVTNEDNSAYLTAGGNNTWDKIYILSSREAEQFKKLLPDAKSDSWLRTPGNQENSAAFYSADNQIMDYGYDVSSTEFKLYPVIRYSIETK